MKNSSHNLFKAVSFKKVSQEHPVLIKFEI